MKSMVDRRRAAGNNGDGAREAAEALAIQALAFLAAEPERIGPFLAAAGLAPENLRAAASEPGFLAAVLDHVAADPVLLDGFATAEGTTLDAVERARQRLSGPALWTST